MIEIGDLLGWAVQNEASDIHLSVNTPPTLRVHGKLNVTLNNEPLTSENLTYLVHSMLNEDKQKILHELGDVDAGLNGDTEEGQRRFRINVGYERGQYYATLRAIPPNIRDIEKIGFPNSSYKEVLTLNSGLVLVTGTTGSGKTTTLAAIIQAINQNQEKKIVTLEDPIEYIHPHLKSIIVQREIGSDVRTFGDGVKYALRQDPDIILIGEIRDRDTAEKALEAAETGHLVLATLHTKSTIQTAQRYIGLFPSDDHHRVQGALADNLAYIFSQQLIPYIKGQKERTLAMEIMNVAGSSSLQSHIRDGDFKQMTTALQTGRKLGMITMDQHIRELSQAGRVPREWAITYAHDRNYMRSALQ